MRKLHRVSAIKGASSAPFLIPREKDSVQEINTLYIFRVRKNSSVSFMEFFLFAQSRFNGYSKSSPRSISIVPKKVGLLVIVEQPFEEAHIVFSTRNLTKSVVEMTIIPSTEDVPADDSTVDVPDDDSTVENNAPIVIIPPPPHVLEAPCLLSTHGLRRGSRNWMSVEQMEETLRLLPMTVCTKHGETSFLPLDYVQRMPEYTCTTRHYPIFQVMHRYDDCVLEFPFPPPICSSEEESLDIDFSRNCYQCFTPLSERKTVFMYRDYIFCCNWCRTIACLSTFWYRTMMNTDEEEEIEFDCDLIFKMEREPIFSISLS